MTRQHTRQAPQAAPAAPPDTLALIAMHGPHAHAICRAHWRAWFRQHPGAFLTPQRSNSTCEVCAAEAAPRERAA